MIPGQNSEKCEFKWAKSMRNALHKKNTWSKLEDENLTKLVNMKNQEEKNGPQKWSFIARKLYFISNLKVFRMGK